MSARLIYSSSVPAVGRVRVTWSAELGEYRVALAPAGVSTIFDYFTDDRTDAVSTAQRMLAEEAARPLNSNGPLHAIRAAREELDELSIDELDECSIDAAALAAFDELDAAAQRALSALDAVRAAARDYLARVPEGSATRPVHNVLRAIDQLSASVR